MGRHTFKASDGEGFLRAFTDAWSDLEMDTDYRVYVSVLRTHRKGVLAIKFEGYRCDADLTGQPTAAYTMEYPTAQVGTLEAALYQAVNKLERLLSDADQVMYGA